MRVEHIGLATLYLGDCFEVLPILEPLGAVVTDPPYGVGFNGEGWDKEIPPLLWLDAAIIKAETVMVISGTTHMFKYPEPTWTLSWARPGSVQRAKGGGFSHWEPILVYGKNPMPYDCKVFPAATGSEWKTDHPCPKPLHVMEWLVAHCKEPICDPFLGSGTTGAAAVKMGKRFIGVEIDERSFDAACRRIEAVQNQRQLFEPARAEQHGLAL